jgi:hypothetical protein
MFLLLGLLLNLFVFALLLDWLFELFVFSLLQLFRFDVLFLGLDLFDLFVSFVDRFGNRRCARCLCGGSVRLEYVAAGKPLD